MTSDSNHNLSGRIRVIQLPEGEEEAVFDEERGILKLPKSDFALIGDKQSTASSCHETWSQEREVVTAKLREIADNLDEWEKGCNISTTVGSSVGVLSSAAIIGGIIIAPPLAIVGLIGGIASGASNLVTAGAKITNLKKKSTIAQEALEKDQLFMDNMKEAIHSLRESLERVAAKYSLKSKKLNGETLANGVASSVGLGSVAIASTLTRLILTESTIASSRLLKCMVHAAAVLAGILDAYSIISASISLSRGSPSAAATELRKIADEMEEERKFIYELYINVVALDTAD